MTSQSSPNTDEMKGLGANERALLGQIGWGPLRRMAIRVVRAKMRVQFTGWLQYLLPVPFLLGFALLGASSWLLGAHTLAVVLFVPAGLITLVAIFDILTSKWKIRLPERRPPRLDHLGAFDLFRARRSCRSFQTRPMSDEDRESVLADVDKHLAAAPIGDSPLRLEYISAPLTVWPTVNASEFLVAIVPKAYNRTAVVDVGRTLQRVVLDATRMGLGTCWIGPGADQKSIVEHLGDRFDAEADHIICVSAVGYQSRYIPLFIRIFNQRMSTRRLSLKELFFADEALEHPLDTTTSAMEGFGPAFEACRWAPSSYNGQTTRAIVETGPDGQMSTMSFLAATASRYYAPVALGIWSANWELACAALGEHGAFESIPQGGTNLQQGDVKWSRSHT